MIRIIFIDCKLFVKQFSCMVLDNVRTFAA